MKIVWVQMSLVLLRCHLMSRLVKFPLFASSVMGNSVSLMDLLAITYQGPCFDALMAKAISSHSEWTRLSEDVNRRHRARAYEQEVMR